MTMTKEKAEQWVHMLNRSSLYSAEAKSARIYLTKLLSKAPFNADSMATGLTAFFRLRALTAPNSKDVIKTIEDEFKKLLPATAHPPSLKVKSAAGMLEEIFKQSEPIRDEKGTQTQLTNMNHVNYYCLALEKDTLTALYNETEKNPSTPYADNLPVLFLAMQLEDNMLIDAVYDQNLCIEHEGETPLCYAARMGTLKPLIQLLGLGAVPTQASLRSGRTPLISAVMADKENLDIIDALLKYESVDILAEIKNQDSAMSLAIDKKHLQTLLRLLAHNSALTPLPKKHREGVNKMLLNARFDEELVTQFIKFLFDNTTGLDLTNITINSDTDKLLAILLEKPNSLTTLFLRGKTISDMHTITYALKTNSVLSYLNLSLNCIEDSAAEELAKALAINTTLTSIDLWKTEINSKFKKSIDQSIERNKKWVAIHGLLSAITSENTDTIATKIQSFYQMYIENSPANPIFKISLTGERFTLFKTLFKSDAVEALFGPPVENPLSTVTCFVDMKKLHQGLSKTPSLSHRHFWQKIFYQAPAATLAAMHKTKCTIL